MTDPDMAAMLRQLKVPERMTSSQALRDFLLANTEDDEPSSPEKLRQLNGLLLLSHLEVVNALGAMEQQSAEQHYEKFRREIEKKTRKRRWF
ncbi:hypothetical protein MB901379_02673 [Mycobacterium basiliense]|uniref:Uncharacterized protein n=1 Tax=Mycobacterium basiliense TaxID=2094119 RepID=A0A3S4CCE6_9MYCO|nr:hypothetical protein [Mycobacterium basiliense]VDM89106.1 hypothetical protein MB901379_02673 [Mycobacterium basiliense]